MWHWIQNALSEKRQQFFFDILILVSCIHIFSIVGAILYQSKRGVEQVSLVAPDIRGSTLVFVPLYKKIEQPKLKSLPSSIQKPHHQMNYDEFLDRQKKVESAKKSAPQKPVQKKAVPKTVPLKSVQNKAESVKPLAQKAGAAKAVLQKTVDKEPAEKSKSVVSPAATSLSNEVVNSKKVASQKVASQKVASQKSLEQKIVDKKSIVPQALDQKKVQEKIEDPAEKVLLKEAKENISEKIPEQQVVEQKIEEVTHQEVVLHSIQKDLISNVADQQENVLPLIDMNDVAFVGVKDLEHLQLQQLVSGQLAKHWRRPVGMEHKLCVIKIELHSTGKIINAIIEKSSGVPMYDMAAKAAALKTTYPQEIWNKKLVIQF